MTPQPLTVGFLGLSHLHPPSYMPLFQAIPGAAVVAVADSNPAVLDRFLKDFPVRGYSDWHNLLERESLDLAVIFLPHADCPDAAVACAQRGIHVLVEKPMAASAEGVRRMIAAAKQAGVILSTPYVWRYHPVALQMKKLIEQGVTGRIVGCEGRCAAGRLVSLQGCPCRLDAQEGPQRRRPHVQSWGPLDRSLPVAAGGRGCRDNWKERTC